MCDDASIRYQLTSMYNACGSDLTGSNSADVLEIYDVLYAIRPMRDAVCSKDDSGDYCVLSIGASSSSSSASASASASAGGGSKEASSSSAYDLYAQVMANLYTYAGSSLSKRDSSSSSLLIPNTTTFSTTGVPFLFLTPSTPSSTLCTTCTKSILTAYTTFEQGSPYALGLDNSPLLGGQNALYDAVESTCGSGFLGGTVNAAGGLSGSVVSGAGPSVRASGSVSVSVGGAMAVVAGVAALL